MTEIYEKDLINNDFRYPLMLINPEKMEYLELNIVKSPIKEYKEQKYYLKRIKKMFRRKKFLQYILEENDNTVNLVLKSLIILNPPFEKFFDI